MLSGDKDWKSVLSDTSLDRTMVCKHDAGMAEYERETLELVEENEKLGYEAKALTGRSVTIHHQKPGTCGRKDVVLGGDNEIRAG